MIIFLLKWILFWESLLVRVHEQVYMGWLVEISWRFSWFSYWVILSFNWMLLATKMVLTLIFVVFRENLKHMKVQDSAMCSLGTITLLQWLSYHNNIKYSLFKFPIVSFFLFSFLFSLQLYKVITFFFSICLNQNPVKVCT